MKFNYTNTLWRTERMCSNRFQSRHREFHTFHTPWTELITFVINPLSRGRPIYSGRHPEVYPASNHSVLRLQLTLIPLSFMTPSWEVMGASALCDCRLAPWLKKPRREYRSSKDVTSTHAKWNVSTVVATSGYWVATSRRHLDVPRTFLNWERKLGDY